jgi:hypothetical protein
MRIIFFISTFFLLQTAAAQQALLDRYSFVEHTADPFGLSTPERDDPALFDTLLTKQGRKLRIARKSVVENSSSTVLFKVRSKVSAEKRVFKFLESNSKSQLDYSILNDSTLLIFLKPTQKSYNLEAYSGANVVAVLQVNVLKYKEEHVVIVPFMDVGFTKDTLSFHLNKIFNQACVSLDIDMKNQFKGVSQKMANPLSPQQYTNQMKELRDVYFEKFPQADKNAFYVFLTPSFTSGEKKGFFVNGKSLAFMPGDTGKVFYRNFAQLLASMIGYLNTSNFENNLMSNGGGLHLDFRQWEQLRHNSHSYSFYDNYEDVKTNNGSVAFYFWKENSKGEISLNGEGILRALHRPFKKNQMYYHLNVNELLFYTIFVWRGFAFCTWHILAVLFIFPILMIIRRILFRRVFSEVKKPWFWKISSFWVLIGLTVFFNVLAFGAIERGLLRFEVKSGLLRDLKAKDLPDVSAIISRGESFRKRNSKNLLSQIIYFKNGNWYSMKRKRVLYFDAHVDGDKILSLKYIKDSDFLALQNYRKNVSSHYMVINYRNLDGGLMDQKVFNHSGVELTDKINLSDPPKRILVFVNGYRPVTSGHDFKSFFADLEKKGLESPNSSNLIFSSDRYEYWNKWNQIDTRFKERINPSDTYYADGHFSVETSNFSSIVNFSSVAAVYPKRCADPKKHTCYRIKMLKNTGLGSEYAYTFNLLRNPSNKSGFKLRQKNGKIAGRNLLQALNELPNGSKNDTVFLVVHSMGFAYSLGMIEELRGKINFGGFYIIAPENASCGKVIPSEWQEIWHYGVNFDIGKEEAPCLQDGIAPQFPIKGLISNRCFFPKELYRKKGFYESHFVGNYKWVLDIPEGAKGHVRQR